jgi:hypothetical protein
MLKDELMIETLEFEILHPNYLLEALLDIYAICVKVQTVTFI